MKIEYYTIDCWNRYGYNDDELKFASVERIRKHILENYKFDPQLVIPKHSLTGMHFEEPHIIVQEYYKTYKTGPKKGEFVLDKNGEKIVIDKEEIHTTKIAHDYSGFTLTRKEFESSHLKQDGYYELSYDILPYEVKEDSILYKAQVFISFVWAVKDFTPEIKTPGVPYQESKTVIREISRSPRYPLRKCQDKYGVSDNLDNWFKTENCFIYSEVGWHKEVLEILD